MGAAKIFFDKHFFFVQLQSKKHKSHIFTKETYNTVRAVKRYRIQPPGVFVVPKPYTHAAGKRKTLIKKFIFASGKAKTASHKAADFCRMRNTVSGVSVLFFNIHRMRLYRCPTTKYLSSLRKGGFPCRDISIITI